MIGDVYDEAMIFSLTLADESYISPRDGLCKFLDAAAVDLLLEPYDIKEGVSRDVVLKRFDDLAGDVIFKTQDYVSVHRSNFHQTYGYHFDQRSTLDNAPKGQAYHALDLLYVSATLQDQMSIEQLALSRKMQDAWIDFAYGKDPRERLDFANKWMVFGPDDKWDVKTEDEDESLRKYSRMKKFLDLGTYQDLLAAVDHICVKRDKMGAVLQRETSDSSFKLESHVQSTEKWFERKAEWCLAAVMIHRACKSAYRAGSRGRRHLEEILFHHLTKAIVQIGIVHDIILIIPSLGS